MITILVSVILPSYNHGNFIGKSIESVLNQTFTDLELIIVDDGSIDNSIEIIKKYAKKDKRIKTIFHEKNKGIPKTFNNGINKAKGKFISIIASDDKWNEYKLEKQIKILEKNENLIVWTEAEIIDAEDNLTGEFYTKRGLLPIKIKNGNIFNELIKGNFIMGSSIILKRENLADIRFNENLKYLNDHQFFVDLAHKYEYYFISETLTFYRMHGKNSIFSNIEEWYKDRIKVNEYFLRKYGDLISNDIKNRILLESTMRYSLIGEKRKADQYLYNAIKLKPFNMMNIINIFLVSVSKNGFIRNFILNFLRRYRTMN